MIRSRLLLASIGLLAITATACGSGDTPDAAGDIAPSDGIGAPDERATDGAPPAAGMCLEGATDCVDTVVDDQPDPSTAKAVEPVEGLQNIRAVGWESIEVDPADQKTVTVYWWSGVEPCNVLSEVAVDYADDAITLTVMEGTSDPDAACIEIAEYHVTTIVLDEEVGPRSILDGADA